MLVLGLCALLFCAGAAACSDKAEPAETNSQPPADRLPPNTYVPLVDANSLNRGTVHYSSWIEQENVVSSFALIAPDPVARYGALYFGILCSEGELSAYLGGVAGVGGGKVEVESRIDLDEPETQFWQGQGVLPLSLAGEPASELFDRLRDAQQLELTIPESRIGPTSIPIGELSRSPILGNLDYCGDYHPTEHRVVAPEYVPVFDLIGTVGPHLTYEALEEAFGSRSVLTTKLSVASYTEDEAANQIRLTLTCDDAGRIEIQLEDLPTDTPSGPIAVSLTIDDAATTTEDWWFANQGDRVTGDAEGIVLLPALLLADHMRLSIPSLGIGPLEFDLRGMFETPVQGNIDHCGNYAES